MFSWQTKKSMVKAVLTKQSPFYVQFYISKNCHLRCKMCNIVEANHDLQPFKTDQIHAIANNLVLIGAGVVLLTGGEPFLRSDIDKIVKIFKQHHLDVRMQTAGLFSKKELIQQCVANGARDINVSIDSLDENLSDYINGVQGSWLNAVKTISYISQIFPKEDSICAFGCVLSRYNIDEIDPILEFTTKIGWWLSLVPVHITNPCHPMNFRGYDEFFSFKEDDYPKVKELVYRLKQKKKEGLRLFDSNDYLDSLYTFITTGHPSWRKNEICDTPNLYFAILPDGSFAPCCDHRLDEKIYLYDENFPKIYHSGDFKRKVREISTRCPGCNFGSFPEMTLSARSMSTIKERILLQIKAQKYSIKPYTENELLSIIRELKEKYSVYKTMKNIPFRDKKFIPSNL